MESILLRNGLVYMDRGFHALDLLLQDGKLHPLTKGTPVEARVVDAANLRIIPGFTDVHTHGAVGVDVNGASPEGLAKISRFFAEHGTTSWLASILTDTVEQTRHAIEAVLAYQEQQKQESTGAELLGIHLEGPFLAAAYKGAMPEHLLQPGSYELVASLQELARGQIRYITLSPEVDKVIELLPKLRALGIVPAIGHSGADYDTSRLAINRGACACTHCCNAMRLLHQHEPAILGAALETDIYCEMICDGLHLHPGIVRLLWKTKGVDRLVAITDSIMAAGLPDGNYHLGVNEVIVKDGDARLAVGNARAGSTLTLDRAMRNIVGFTGRPLEQILPVLTENPARLIRVFDRKGSIAEGKDADLLVLDGHNNPTKIFLRGKPLYNLEKLG